jgi:dolichyl-diphosphooligosaccharide--protein glycosyltransferase
MTAAALYKVVSFVGVNVDLMTFASILPAVMGAISCLFIYFVGKDLGGKATGLIAALFLAISPSFIGRTSLGFFDTEVPGILALLLFILLFLRAIEENRTLRSSLTYTLGAALALAYFTVSWGAAYYLMGLASLFVFALILLKRYNPRILLSYSIIFGITLFVATKVPEISLSYLTSGPIVPVAGVFLLLCLAEVLRNNISIRTKLLMTVAAVAVIVGGFVALWQLGYMASIAGKFITVLDPFIRSASPLIASVAEHRVSAWGNIYYELGAGVLFFLAGLYFTLRNPTNRNIFLLLFGLTSLYFAASMVRLLTVFAPAFSLLVAAGISGILKPFYTLLREAPRVVVKMKRGMSRVSKEYSAIAIFLIFVVLVTQLAFSPWNGSEPGVPRVIHDQSYSPLTITSSSMPLTNVDEWTDMLLWTQSNLKSGTVVVAWWDYGYWLTILGNVTTLCDNATVNATQIENVGFILMGNETMALKMLERYDAEYILVFTTLGISQVSEQQYSASPLGYGDEGKWVWMADISGQAHDRLLEDGFMTSDYQWTDKTAFGYNATTGQSTWNDMGRNSTIYKLMGWAKQRWAEESGAYQYGVLVTPDEESVQPLYFKEAYFAGEDVSPYKYSGRIPIVALYEIDWEKYHNATNTIG